MALGKKTLYIMLPVNLCLWSYISYVIYEHLNEHEEIIPIENTIANLKIESDTNSYQLILNYPDPFLKEEPKQNLKLNTNTTQINPPVKQPKIAPVKVSSPAKDIKYLGLIQNKTSGSTTALISVDGKSFIIKKGEIIEGINFLSITDETIIAKIGKEKVIINKS